MSYNNLNLKSSPLTWKDVTYRRTTPCRLIVSLRSSSWFRTKNKIMLQTHISEYIRFDKASRFCVKSAFRGFNASKFLVKRVYIYVHVYLQRCPGLLNHLVFFHFQNQLLRELFFFQANNIRIGDRFLHSIQGLFRGNTWIFKQFQAARKTHDLCLLLFFNHVWRVPWVYQTKNPG